MNIWRKFQLRFRALFARHRLDVEMDEELRTHIEMRTQENIKAGMSHEQVRYAALRQFGWAESIKETCREQRGVSWIENLGQDIRYGARPQSFGSAYWNLRGNLVVRTSVPPRGVAETVRQSILGVDPDQPVAKIRTMEEVIAASVGQRRFILMLIGVFAGAALLLAAIGLYGVLAYVVSQRTREIGIRVALGATRVDVLGLVLRQGMKLAAIGILLGVIGALGLTRVLVNLLYEIKPTDPLTFVGVSLVLFLVTLLACWLPARRAAKVDPMEALRYE